MNGKRTIGLLTLFLGLLGTGAAQANKVDAWPERPVRLIVPAGAGSGTDIMARMMADFLGKELKQSFIVENKPGANGIIGNNAGAKSAPDGYTLLFSNASSVSMNAALRSNLPYDTFKDLKPVVIVTKGGVLLAANPDTGIRNLKDFLAYARAHPGMSYGSWGPGSSGHLTMEALAAANQLRLQHVAYRSMGQIAPAVLGGEIKVAFVDARSSLTLVKSGKLAAVAMTGRNRAPMLPEVLTLLEQGSDIDLDGWQGILAPAGTPDAIVQRVHDAVTRIRTDPVLSVTFKEQNVAPLPRMSSAQFAALIRDEVPMWRKLIESTGIKPD